MASDYHLGIVGSSTADVEAFSQYILDEMTKRLPHVTFHFRCNDKQEPSSAIETFVMKVAEMWGKDTYYYRPSDAASSARSGVPRSQRTKNYIRDIVLVDGCDEIVAFFDPERVMEGGTGHIIEAALRMDKPCRAYTIRNGRLEEVGDWS